MNEKIRELAKQAGAEIHGHPDYATICVNGQDADALMKKFAELIIKECADVCYRIDDEYDGEDVSATWCAEGILKHFGEAKLKEKNT